MLNEEERQWLIKSLENDIRAIEEDVSISGRWDDLEMAKQILAKLKQ